MVVRKQQNLSYIQIAISHERYPYFKIQFKLLKINIKMNKVYINVGQVIDDKTHNSGEEFLQLS